MHKSRDHGINNVLIVHFSNAQVEFWKDAKEVYHVGIAYKKNGEEYRYMHYIKGKEPKLWNQKVDKIKEIYDRMPCKSTSQLSGRMKMRG